MSKAVYAHRMIMDLFRSNSGHTLPCCVTRNSKGAFVSQKNANGMVGKMPFCMVVFVFQYMKSVSFLTNVVLNYL